ncbi:MAG: ribosome maturation factor RimP [Alphaproteobacteria bacterium]|nr:ribosome maturation factor RimP [Alphaproteobacteria bacterium]
MGFELVAVELTGDPSGHAVLRVSVDQRGGVDIDALGRLSRAISPALDVDDPVPGAYNLEVSSPGIDRPLQRFADFERFAGFRARLRMDASQTRRRYSGVLRGVSDDAVPTVLIEVDGQEHALPFEHILKARLVLELSEYLALAEPTAPQTEPIGGTS